MNCRHLNMDEYKRKNHFDYFKSLPFPYVGLTVNVNISELLSEIKARRLPFFLTFNYCAAASLNQIPELRQRISENGIIEFDNCRTSHTVALEDGTYCYCTLDCGMPFEDYLPYAIRTQEAAKQENVTQDEGDVRDFIFISTLPWTSYTSLIQPVPIPADSNPRITWGAFFKQGADTLLPVSVLCNHALVDGLHISRFYEALDKKTAEVAGIIHRMKPL